MHHLKYTRSGSVGRRDIFGYEAPADLVALCRACHTAEHTDAAGFFWRYPDMKKRIAR